MTRTSGPANSGRKAADSSRSRSGAARRPFSIANASSAPISSSAAGTSSGIRSVSLNAASMLVPAPSKRSVGSSRVPSSSVRQAGPPSGYFRRPPPRKSLCNRSAVIAMADPSSPLTRKLRASCASSTHTRVIAEGRTAIMGMQSGPCCPVPSQAGSPLTERTRSSKVATRNQVRRETGSRVAASCGARSLTSALTTSGVPCRRKR